MSKYLIYSLFCLGFTGIFYLVTGDLILTIIVCLLYLLFFFGLYNFKASEFSKKIDRNYEAISFMNNFIISLSVTNSINATYEAMREAINNLTVKPDILLNDAVTIPGVDIEQVPIIKGDAKSLSIASASIIAKVTRDRLMYHYDELYPEYGFAKHKGYGTKLHTDVLKEIGPCPIHRKTFITKICP